MIMGILSACGNKAKKVDVIEEVEVHAIEAALTAQEKVDVGETVAIEVLVTYGDEKVEDADKVAFEIWEEGKKEESITIESENKKDGVYSAETTFDHDGTFNIQSHVDARAQHTMPIAIVTVGDGGNYEEGQEHADYEDGFSMHFMKPEEVKINAENELMVHLELEGKVFEKANVRYEIWNADGEGKHDWIDVEQPKTGEYTANYTFEKVGKFNIQVHVQDDNDLHEHEIHEIDVSE